MATETEIKITEGEYDGNITWAAWGQVDKGQFLLALLEQHGESLKERIREGRRMPMVEDVDHEFGMRAECADDTFLSVEIHNKTCDDPAECDFDPAKCKWVTWLCDEALWPVAQADASAEAHPAIDSATGEYCENPACHGEPASTTPEPLNTSQIECRHGYDVCPMCDAHANRGSVSQ